MDRTKRANSTISDAEKLHALWEITKQFAECLTYDVDKLDAIGFLYGDGATTDLILALGYTQEDIAEYEKREREDEERCRNANLCDLHA